MTDFDPESFAAGIKLENAAELKRVEARFQEAMHEAAKLASTIKSADPGVLKVLLFGSLAEGIPTHPDFDIDLALVGGDPHKAMLVVEDSAFKVDIVMLDRLPEGMRKRILENGKEL